MSQINTINGPMDESLLLKREGSTDNDNETAVTVEYCLKDCPGDAHKTGVADSEGHFCNLHVHRSAHVTLKKNVTAEGVAASFG